MYNAATFIGDCLESILAQTFQNFEVIVVDDCSTDNSVAAVQSYAEKFGERLRLLTLKKKSNGGGSVPRNKGLTFSRGKYIFFMDSDDAIIETAFEELYNIAEKFKADVVHCEKYYAIPDEIWHDENLRKRQKPYNYLTGEKVLFKEPTLLSTNLEERVIFFGKRQLIWNFWVQLIRREFILENEIKLPDAVAQDTIFTICSLCCAERYVVVPNVINLYHKRKNSVSREKLNVGDQLHKWVSACKLGVRYLDEFLGERAFFVQRPNLKYILFDFLVREFSRHLYEIYAGMPAPALEELLRKEFGDGDNTALTAFVFSTMNIQQLQSLQMQQQFNRFAAAAQKRIAELEAEVKRLKS